MKGAVRPQAVIRQRGNPAEHQVVCAGERTTGGGSENNDLVPISLGYAKDGGHLALSDSLTNHNVL